MSSYQSESDNIISSSSNIEGTSGTNEPASTESTSGMEERISSPGEGDEDPDEGYENPGEGDEDPGEGYEDPGEGDEYLGEVDEYPGEGDEDPGEGDEDPGEGNEDPGVGEDEGEDEYKFTESDINNKETTPTGSSYLSSGSSKQISGEERKSLKFKPDNLERINSEIIIQKISYDLQEDNIKKTENEVDLQTFVPNKEPLITTPVDSEFDENEGIDELSEEEKEDVSDTPFIAVLLETISREKMTIYYKVNTRIEEVKKNIGTIFNVESEVVKLSHEGKECNNKLCLSEFGQPPEVIKFDIASTKPKEFLSPGQFHRYKNFQKDIIVKIPKDEGGFKEIKVQIENQCYFKQWYGGYRNKITNVEYHNKIIQTLPKLRSPDLPPVYTRQTQTPVFPLKDFTEITYRNKSTQMWRPDFYIPNENDKIVIGKANRFVDQDPWKIIQLQRSILLLQRLFRKMIAMRELEKERQILNEQKMNEQKVRDSIHQNLIISNRRQIIGTTFPIDRGNFYLLYLLVGKWWANEMNIIKKMKRNESRKAAVYNIIEKEIHFLYEIDKQRNKAKKEILQRQEMSFLETTARPIIFRNHKGIISSIDTVETQQAREYQEIMASYLTKNKSVEQRIDTLVNLKYLIMTFGHYEWSREILTLINQECDLLRAGMSNRQLSGLRERILQLLQCYLHTYIVNPSSKRYIKPNYPKTVKSLYQCKYCKKLKPASDYNVHVRLTSFSICHSCEWMKNIGHQRMDLTPYSRILEQVRESEMKKCCYSSNCFVLQPIGMCYLVQKIWYNLSVISECGNLDELRMVRFRNEEDWSPWNTILLTLEESAAHAGISNAENFYSEWFIKKVRRRHMRAKNVFLPLLLNDKQMTESGLWLDVTDSGKFFHPSHIQQFAKHPDFKFL